MRESLLLHIEDITDHNNRVLASPSSLDGVWYHLCTCKREFYGSGSVLESALEVYMLKGVALGEGSEI